MLPRNPNVESIFPLPLIFKINFQNFWSRLSASLKTAWRTSVQGTKDYAGSETAHSLCGRWEGPGKTETAHSLWWEVERAGDGCNRC